MERKENEILYDLWLDGITGMTAVKKVGFASIFGGSRSLYFAKRENFIERLREQSIQECLDAGQYCRLQKKDLTQAEKQLKHMEKCGIGATSFLSQDYPQSLRNLPGAPWMLYYRGNRELWDQEGIAVVGARKCTDYGRWAAFELGRKLAAAGIPVISGMAYGVDSSAHRGALEAAELNRSTIAVFGCGVDVCYPRSNERLMEKIIEDGLIVSEFSPGTEPRPFYFPVRNRIISGLSRGVVVVEAGLQSGSLITAEIAAEQGKDVFAVPGNINRPMSIGANKLIQDGAIPLAVLDDILEYLGITHKDFTENLQKKLGNDERTLYNKILDAGEIRADQLAVQSGMPIGKVNALVTVLEMKGILRTSLGKIFIAKT